MDDKQRIEKQGAEKKPSLRERLHLGGRLRVGEKLHVGKRLKKTLIIAACVAAGCGAVWGGLTIARNAQRGDVNVYAVNDFAMTDYWGDSSNTSGSYLLGGRDVTTCNNKQLAEVRNKELGFVFQSFNLLPKLTALENVALPLLYGGVKKAERLERARAALETVGLSDRVDHRPDQLSGGQCQRVAIARAIVGNPKLLLADEPTGALDSASGAAVMELFQQLHDGGSTIIMITHDHSIANHAAKVMTIRDGVLSGGDDYE